jgi:hypothetical protein
MAIWQPELVAVGAALVIGTTLGLLGAGGSIMTVPLLVYVVGLAPRAAMTMALVVVGATSASAALLHARSGHVRARLAVPFALAGAPGAFAGGRLAFLVPERWLMLAFAAFMVAAAVALRRRPDDGGGSVLEAPAPPVALVAAAGFGLGLVTGFLGAGGGFLIVPTLVLLFGVPMRHAIGSSLVVITANAGIGLAARADAEGLDGRLTALLTAFAIAGAVIGHRVSGRMPQATLKRWFAGLVLVVAAYIVARDLIWGGARG